MQLQAKSLADEEGRGGGGDCTEHETRSRVSARHSLDVSVESEHLVVVALFLFSIIIKSLFQQRVQAEFIPH